MDRNRKKQALEILDYWKTVEFLGQIDIPEESAANKKIIEKIKRNEKVNVNKIDIFSMISEPYLPMEQKLEADGREYIQFPAAGGEVSFSVGRIGRNSIVEYLEKYVENAEERPEMAYPYSMGNIGMGNMPGGKKP